MKSSRVSDLRFAGYYESVFRRMVADTPLLFHGWRHWRRPLRTHSPAALVEKIAARVVLGDSAEHRDSVAAVLDSGASRDHGVRRCCPCADVLVRRRRFLLIGLRL